MSVSLDKRTHAITDDGTLMFRGKIVRNAGHTITIKIESAFGIHSKISYTHSLAGKIAAFPRVNCDLYK